MPETLTADEIRDVRAMLDERPRTQAALKMGTSDRPTRDGHAHRDNVIREQGAGAPTHVAKEGTFYWDTTSKVQYVNSNGSTTWAEQASGGAEGAHTLHGLSHSDVSNLVTPASGHVLVHTGTGWVSAPADIHGTHFTDALARAAVPYEIYLSFGSEREVFSPA